MYGNSDFESFFIRYKAEAAPVGESIEQFCFRNHLLYNLFEKWTRTPVTRLLPFRCKALLQVSKILFLLLRSLFLFKAWRLSVSLWIFV